VPLLLKTCICIGSETCNSYHSSRATVITLNQQHRRLQNGIANQVSTLTSCALLTSKCSAMGTANLPSAHKSQIMQSNKSSQTRVTDSFRSLRVVTFEHCRRTVASPGRLHLPIINCQHVLMDVLWGAKCSDEPSFADGSVCVDYHVHAGLASADVAGSLGLAQRRKEQQTDADRLHGRIYSTAHAVQLKIAAP